MCAGCDKKFNLCRPDARDRVHVYLAELPARGEDITDWPATVCHRCAAVMGDNFLDFRFARHPQCPNCKARRTKKVTYGFPRRLTVEPWRYVSGYTLLPEKWTCSECMHMW